MIENSAFPVPVPATVGGATIQTVDARRLYEKLGVGKDFSTWFADRIRQYEFTENVDFCISPEIGEKSAKGRPAKEYAISLDMAKELCMVERNDAGKAARRYYIECERRVQGHDTAAALSDPAHLRSLLLQNVEKVIFLQSRVAEMEPEVAAFERLAVSEGSLCFRDAAKVLQVRPKDLTDFLVSHGWVYTRLGVPGYIAYQPKLQAGLLEHKTTTVHRSDGSEKVVSQCRITPKGLARLAKEFPPIAQAA